MTPSQESAAPLAEDRSLRGQALSEDLTVALSPYGPAEVIGNTLTCDPKRVRAELQSNGVEHGYFRFVGPDKTGFYKIEAWLRLSPAQPQ